MFTAAQSSSVITSLLEQRMSCEACETPASSRSSLHPIIILITGPQWVPRGFFEKFYGDRIRAEFAAGNSFRVGAASGVDEFAQELLADLFAMHGETDFTRVVVFNKGDKDGRKSSKFLLVNGFASYPERDAAMAHGVNDVMCTLPLFGGGVSGSVVPLLTALSPLETKAAALLRAHSEPWWTQEQLDTHIIPLYKLLYPERKKE